MLRQAKRKGAKMRLYYILAAFFIISLSVGFSQEGAKPEPPLDPSIVLKIDDNIVIKREEIEKEMMQRLGKEFLEQRISEILLEREAKRLAVSVTQEEVAKELDEKDEVDITDHVSDLKRLEKELKDRNYTLDRWQEAVQKLGEEGGYITQARKEATANLERELSRYGHTIQTRKEAMTDPARFQLLSRKVVIERRVQENTLRELFGERFLNEPGLNVWVKVILLSSPPEAEEMRRRAAKMEESAPALESEELRKNALERVTQLRAQADQKELENANAVVARGRAGEDFAKIAQEKGAGWSKTDFDIGWLKLNKLSDQIAAALEKMKVGETSEPIKTPWGYQIIYLCAKKSNDELKYEDVKDSLAAQQRIAPVNADELYRLDAQLRESAKITRNLK